MDRHPRYASAFAVLALLALTEAVYLRMDILRGAQALVALDYDQLHIRRIAFARDALFGIRHTLPAWYPNETLGAPFAANLQSFPWIPNRLLLLLLDPSIAYAAGIALAAALSAIFTWLYCRRVGMSRIAAVAAAWTFACAGYFSSRVMVGHLPLLEAYPALPLLLWLVDRALAPERQGRRRLDLAILALASACVAAAGHPQLPAYSLASALLYTVWRGRGWLQARVAGAILLGVGLTLAVWWPMLLLIGRSTRVLHLAAADNDVSMPYSRLLALILPGVHGWAEPVILSAAHPFTGYPNNAYFWDTASYAGILPLVAMAGLLIACLLRKRVPDWRWTFLACLGAGAFLGSLPLAGLLFHALPMTLLRSPARLLYLSTFGAAVALGAAVDAVPELRWPRALTNCVLVVCLSLHFADLWGFAHWFIRLTPRQDQTPDFLALLDRELGNGRVAEQREELSFSYRNRYDDAGGFDSIFLARFYRGLLALEGAPPNLNPEEDLDASELPVNALEAMGVRFVIATAARKDLELAGSTPNAYLYRVANPAPRADFFAESQAEFAAEQQIPESFAANPRNRLLLPPDARKYSPRLVDRVSDDSSIRPDTVGYTRVSSDEILLRPAGAQAGFVHVVEAYDPGWTATVDGAEGVVLPANGFTMAVPVEGGSHTVRLRYRTPGRDAGAGLSMVSLGLLTVLIASTKR